MSSPLPIRMYYQTIQDRDLAPATFGGSTGTIDVKVGYNVKDWKGKIKLRQNASSPYERVVFPARGSSARDVDWTWKWKDYDGKTRVSRLYGCPLGDQGIPMMTAVPTSPYLQRARSDAKLAFLSKLREERSTFQALPFFGELKETLGMLRHPLRGILRNTRQYYNESSRLQRLLRSKPNRLADSLETAYLQWTYGVSPFVADIEGIRGGITKLFETPDVKRLSVSVQVPQHSLPSAYWKGMNYYEGGSIAVWSCRNATISGKVRITGAYKSVLVGPSLDKLRELSSFELRDVVPAMWELLPYSFCVDYFSTVGDVIGGLFTNTRDMIYANISEKLIVRGDVLAMPCPGTFNPIRWPISIPVLTHLEKVSFKREPADLTVGFSDLQWRMPSARQALNMGVLALQRLRTLVSGNKTPGAAIPR